MTSSEFKTLKNAAVSLLSRRDYSHKELFNRLSVKSSNKEVIRDVLSELIALGYQSDERFAESFVRYRRNQGKGPLRIRMDLRQKGIDDALIDTVLSLDDLDDVGSCRSWFEDAKRLYETKFGSVPVADSKEKAKRLRFMIGRGFSPSDAYQLVAASSV